MKLLAFSTLAISCISLTLLADEYHYNNLIVGGSAIGMGGAFVSIANDLSATHYNPAGLAFAKNHTTASINTFAWEKTEFTNVFSNGESFTRDSFSVVPGFFGASRDYGRWTIGASLAVTDFSKERTSDDAFYALPPTDGATSNQVNEFISIDLESSAYRFALGTGYKVNDSLALGAALNIEYRDFKTVQASGVRSALVFDQFTLANGFHASRRFTDTNIIMQPTLSMLWQQNGYAFGARLGKEFSVSRDYVSTSSIYLASPVALPPFVQVASRFTEQSEEKQNYPYQLAIGNSYQWDKLLFSFDIVHFSEVNQESSLEDEMYAIVLRDLKQVTNFALGMSYNLADKSYLKLGIFTDNSNAVLDRDINFQRIEDIDLLGVSLAYDTEVLQHPVSLGFYYKAGRGDIRIADVRVVDQVVGIPLYPPSDNYDIIKGKKRAMVAYFSVNF